MSGGGGAKDTPPSASLPGESPYTPEALAFSEIGRITGPHGVRGELKLRAATDWARQRLAPDTQLPRRQGRRYRDGVSPPPPPAATVKPRHPPPQRYLLLPGRLYPRPVGVTVSRKASQAGVWIVGLDCCTSREEVAGLVGGRLYVRASERPRMGAGEFLIQDLVGMDVLLRPPGGGREPPPLADDTATAPTSGGDSTTTVSSAETVARAAAQTPSPPLPVIGRIAAVMTRDQLAAGATEESTAVLGGDVLEVALGDFAAAEAPGGGGVSAWDWADAKRVLVPFVRPIVPVVDLARRVVEVDPPAGLFETAVVPRRGGIKVRGLLAAAASTEREEKEG
ncbi:hypothetical protein MMPV_007993 [Pyropia vietnamensis]